MTVETTGSPAAPVAPAVPQTPEAKLDALLASRGAATLNELGLAPPQALELAKKRPDVEPVYLVRFRSRQDKVRVEEVRAYAWPSQKIALRHLGYRAEASRLLRLEPRARVPFPERLYAEYEKDPKQLEALRVVEKAYQKAVKQAPSKPGRCEMDLTPLQPAFAKLGDGLAMEMWIEAASIFQALDNAAYASKMLGNLLKLVSKDKKTDPSMLARIVLAAADDGVFNGKLYEFTWDLLQSKLSTETALGFGLRVFRRLLESGRALPTDFTKDLRRAAAKGKVAQFEPLFDANVLWAAGLATFWNMAKRSSSWGSEETADHAETNLLRTRLRELWQKASAGGEEGEAWKAALWGRIQAVQSELTPYGRTVLVENLLQMADPGRVDAERLLEATLSLLTRPARVQDRPRVERAALEALTKLATAHPDLLWEKASLFEQTLKTSATQLAAFVSTYDILSDLSEQLGPKGDKADLVHSLPGLAAAWSSALVSALTPKKGDDDDDDSEEESISSAETVVHIHEALRLITPETAGEHLTELGPRLSRRLANDLRSDDALGIWARVLGPLQALGPLGRAVTQDATARFVKRGGQDATLANAVPLIRFLDGEALRTPAEARTLVDDAISQLLVTEAPATFIALDRPVAELTDSSKLADALMRPDGSFAMLWTKNPKDRWTDKPLGELAITTFGLDNKQKVLAKGDVKDGAAAKLWDTSAGLRVLVTKGQSLLLYGEDLSKPLQKLKMAESDSSGGEFTTLGDLAYVQFGGRYVVVDPELKVQIEFDTEGGNFKFLRGEKGSELIVVRSNYRSMKSITVGLTKAVPLPKIPDSASVQFWARTAGDGIVVQYATKKGVLKHLRYDPAVSEWITADAGPAPAGGWLDIQWEGWDNPVSDRRLDLRINGNSSTLSLDTQSGGRLVRMKLEEGGTLYAVDVARGRALTSAGVSIDPSLLDRMAATPFIEALGGDTPGDAAAAAAYGTKEERAAWLQSQIEARPGGKEALAKLGKAAAPMLLDVSEGMESLQDARKRVLEALKAPPAAPPAVPGHVPGVRRTLLRRTMREEFSQVDALAFWAIDSRTPGVLVDALVPAKGTPDSSAFALAAQAIFIAQKPKTEVALAERLLELGEALVTQLEDPKRVFSFEPAEAVKIDDDEDDPGYISSDRAEGLRDPSKNSLVLWSPSGHFPPKAPPVKLPKENDADYRAAISGWVKDAFADLGVDKYEELAGKGPYAQHRVHFKASGHTFSVDIVTKREDEGLGWQHHDLAGNAPAEVWAAVAEKLSRVYASLPIEEGSSPEIVLGAVHSPADLAALHAGAALTRAHLADREVLRPDRWPAPRPKNVTEEPEAKLLMLTWIFGSMVGDTLHISKQNMERYATKNKGYEFSKYNGKLELKKGDKTGFAVPVGDGLRSARLKGMLSFGAVDYSGVDFDKLLVLQEPSYFANAYAQEAGIPVAGEGKKP
jgi:hypothetical protein